MFKIVPLNIEHLIELYDEPSNRFLKDWIQSGFAKEMMKSGLAGTFNDKVVVCGGFVECWTNRAQIWSVWSRECKNNFVPIFRGLKKLIHSQKYNRIEFAVPVYLTSAHRRAKLLGFEVECELAKKFLPDGSDCVLYALVRGS